MRWNKEMFKIIMSVFLFIFALFFKNYDELYLALILISYLIISFDIIKEAFSNILKGDFFDENTLMIIATISAFIIGEYEEALMVMLLFEVGEYLSSLAIYNSKKSITKLMDLRCDYINLKRDNLVFKTAINEAKEGDIFIVKPGEMVPLDGILIDGESFVDTLSLTGESVPKRVQMGDEVLSGFINGDSVITVKATSEVFTSTASKIINLLEKTEDRKTNTERFITRFSRVYTPLVTIFAFLIVLIPVMFGADFNTYLYKSLVFLVTACPCALVISVPLGFFCGVGKASKEGILVKGSDSLENLAKVETIVFDKTGTITEGNFKVKEVVSEEVSEDDLLMMAAYLEYYSNHPIAMAIIKAYSKKIDVSQIKNYKEESGYGVRASVFGKDLMIGNEEMFIKENIAIPKVEVFGTVVFVASFGKYLGYLVVGDEIKKSAYNLTSFLKKLGINKTVMLSGDNFQMVSSVASRVKIDEYYAKLLPVCKAEKLKELMKDSYTAFAGDGINDALVIKQADVGISMGGIGSDVAIEASDIVLMNDDLNKICVAIKLARRVQKIIRFNIAFALGVKFLMLILATFGFTSIWMAVFADVGVTLLVILNVLRIMKFDL